MNTTYTVKHIQKGPTLFVKEEKIPGMNTTYTVKHIQKGPTLFVNMEFLAEIAKIVPQGDTTFSPCEKIYFAPPEEKRFSKSF